jgi:hypothetical protein
MDTSNGVDKKYTYIVAGIIAIGLITWGAYTNTRKNAKVEQQDAQQNANAATSTPPAAISTSAPPTTAKPAIKKLSYGDAIQAYPFRFQFSQCHGNPGSMTVKKGTKVMLDNRDSTAHSIKIGSQTFKIAGYDYAVYYSPTIGLLNITCDGGGSATINVEK